MANVNTAIENNLKPITTLLVANRGEIARRIMRTAKEMGISTVAIYADGDAQAPFVTEADSAIALGGRTSAETYLDVSKVLDACKRSGADAVHPGYGFLSENADFARAISDAGISWIGPTPDVISAMGDKLSAKELMEKAEVPTLPAIEITPETDLVRAAGEIGYPVLVKASAGGGGRGMRVVENEADLKVSVDSAKREAGSSFGNDTVFLEKWLDSSRHVEIQIIGDKHGNLVHCFERECSIQRRHQKIIEEAPSPAVSPEIREAMCNAALKAALSLGYSSAGTVEFLLSGSEFYFLEVNCMWFSNNWCLPNVVRSREPPVVPKAPMAGGGGPVQCFQIKKITAINCDQTTGRGGGAKESFIGVWIGGCVNADAGNARVGIEPVTNSLDAIQGQQRE